MVCINYVPSPSIMLHVTLHLFYGTLLIVLVALVLKTLSKFSFVWFSYSFCLQHNIVFDRNRDFAVSAFWRFGMPVFRQMQNILPKWTVFAKMHCFGRNKQFLPNRSVSAEINCSVIINSYGGSNLFLPKHAFLAERRCVGQKIG